MEDASVRMTVDSSQAITENQKYLRAATETFNILQQKAAAYSQDLQKRIKFMEREIELQKESNRLNREKTIGGYREEYEEGKISGKQRNRLIREAREEADTDEQELRETQRLVQEHKRQQQDDLRRQQREDQGDGRGGEGFGRLVSSVAGADTAGGMISGASGALLAGTIVGAVAAIGVSQLVKGAMAMEPAIRDYSILTGNTMSSMSGAGGVVSDLDVVRLAKMGIIPSQYYSGTAQLMRAGGGIMNEDSMGILAAEKATGISRGQTSQLMGIERYGEGKITPLMSTFERYLKETKQNIAVLPEILQTFSNEAQAMIRVSGRVDSDKIAGTIAAISKGTGLTGEPLSIVTGALRGGLQESSDPTIRAMQMVAMERAMPGASFLKIRMAMEKPFETPGYMPNMLELIRNAAGGDQDRETMYLQGAFGGSGMTLNLANDIARGKIKTSNIWEEIRKAKATAEGGFESEAVAQTGALEGVTALWQGEREQKGLVAITESVETLKSVLTGLETIMQDAAKAQKIHDDAIAKAQAEIMEQAEKSNALVKFWLTLVSKNLNNPMGGRQSFSSPY